MEYEYDCFKEVNTKEVESWLVRNRIYFRWFSIGIFTGLILTITLLLILIKIQPHT